nr:tyrosine-type recombinase/integrase [Arthrobacter pigmenti]
MITTAEFTWRPIPHPRTGRPADFLYAHHRNRLGQGAVRCRTQPCGASCRTWRITPHQLRHTYATVLINAGVSLQVLMSLLGLGHVSAEMSLQSPDGQRILPTHPSPGSMRPYANICEQNYETVPKTLTCAGGVFVGSRQEVPGC